MKRYIIFFLLFNCFVLNGIAQQESSRLTNLRKAYNQLSDTITQKAQENFFWAFPESWREFLFVDYVMTCHNEDFSLYVDEFAKLASDINDTLYCTKLIELTRGADYDCDCPNMVQSLLHVVMGDGSFSSYTGGDKSDIMLSLLSRELKGDIMRFWQFYWSFLYHVEDGGANNDYSFNDDYYRLRDILVKEYPDMVEPMTIAYQYFHHEVLFISSYRGLSSNNSSQSYNVDSTIATPEDSVYLTVDKIPEFPGGMDKMMEFISSNIHYPTNAIKEKITGRVTLRFIVEKDGSIQTVYRHNAKYNLPNPTDVITNETQDIFNEMEQAAIRVVKSMPKWNPGEFKKEVVRTSLILPIMFELSPTDQL